MQVLCHVYRSIHDGTLRLRDASYLSVLTTMNGDSGPVTTLSSSRTITSGSELHRANAR